MIQNTSRRTLLCLCGRLMPYDAARCVCGRNLKTALDITQLPSYITPWDWADIYGLKHIPKK